jgi:sugar (pentulose or hexulose) kinase
LLHRLVVGIARIEALGYRRLAEPGMPALARLRSVGGGARNPAWRRPSTRIFGVNGADVLSEDAAVGAVRRAAGALCRAS